MKRPLLAGLLISYVLLVGAALLYLELPWNLAVAGILLFKGLVFWAVVLRVGQIGRYR